MIAAIVLAAGAGRRFGGGPKPLGLRRGRPLLAHAMRAARAAPAARLLVVTGRQHPRIAAAARAIDRRVVIVRAAGWRAGRRASLLAASRALWPVERAAFVFLADMPDVPWRLARRLAGPAPARPTQRGRPGHPVLLSRALLSVGGRGVAMRTVSADRRAVFDVDRRRDLMRRVPALR